MNWRMGLRKAVRCFSMLVIAALFGIGCSDDDDDKDHDVNYGLGGYWVGTFEYNNPWGGFNDCAEWKMYLNLTDEGTVTPSYCEPKWYSCFAYYIDYYFEGDYTKTGTTFEADVHKVAGRQYYFDGHLTGIYYSNPEKISGTFVDTSSSTALYGAWSVSKMAGEGPDDHSLSIGPTDLE